MAHEADIDRTYVSALERSLYSASLDTIEQIAAALGVEPYKLLLPDAQRDDEPDDQVDDEANESSG